MESLIPLAPMLGTFVVCLVIVGIAALCSGKSEGGETWSDPEDV